MGVQDGYHLRRGQRRRRRKEELQSAQRRMQKWLRVGYNVQSLGERVHGPPQE